LVVTVYQALHNRQQAPLIDSRLSRFVLPAYTLTALFVMFAATSGYTPPLEGRFTYLILGATFFALPLFVLSRRAVIATWPSFASIAFFSYTTLLFEVTAAVRHYWVFNGSYILPPLHIAGLAVAPYEELLFVGAVGPAAAIAFFEVFGSGSQAEATRPRAP
jgi:hypothetical protein